MFYIILSTLYNILNVYIWLIRLVHLNKINILIIYIKWYTILLKLINK